MLHLFPLPVVTMLRYFVRAVLVAVLCFTLVNGEVVRVKVGEPGIVFRQRDFENGPDCGDKRTFVHGATILFNFTGTAVAIIGSMGHSGGVHQVFLDGALEHTFDRYAPELHCGKITFEKANLPYAPHSVLMVFQGDTPGGITEGRPGYMPIIEMQYTVPDQSISLSLSSSATVEPTAEPTTSSTSLSAGADGSKKIPLGAIIGAAVGGVIILVLLAVLVWFFFFRKSRKSRTQSLDPSYQPEAAGVTPFNWDASWVQPVNATSEQKPAVNSPTVAGESDASSRLGLVQGARPGYNTGSSSHLTEKPSPSSPPMSPAGLDGSTIAPTSPPASTVTPLPLQEEDVQRIAQALMDRSAQVHGQVAGPPPAYG